MKTKQLKNIKTGDFVLSNNGNTQEFKKVTFAAKTGKRDLFKYILDNNEYIICTPDHKFKTSNGEYIPISHLEYINNNKIISKKFYKTDDVYDIEVQDNHNFVLKNNAVAHNCRAGAQVPFSSLNYGTGITAEQRMITKALLEETDKGLGHGETPIFPVQIFKLKDGVNTKPGDPNYDLFELACKVSAKRLFPNFSFIDSPFNLQYYKKGKPETEVAIMGCVGAETKINVYNPYTRTYSNPKIGDFVLYNNAKSYFVYDSSVKRYVKILNIINNPKVKNWYDVEVKIVGQWGTGYQHLKLTGDHYLPVISGNTTTRTIVTDLKEGDEIPCSPDCEGPRNCFIQKITKLDIQEKSYCLETETDRFDINGINSHNCRTRVAGNTYDQNNEVFPGRGNVFFVTINLPRLGILANHNIKKFFELFDEKIDDCIKQLEERFELISHKHVYNYPFLMGQGVYSGSEKLKWDDEIGEVLKQGSLSIGFIGLAECLIALIGEHHGESLRARMLGLDIIKHLRKRLDNYSKETKMNWSCFATPAESTCLTKDTTVQTPNGLKRIIDLQENDDIISYNTKTKKIEIDKVVEVSKTKKHAQLMCIAFKHANGKTLKIKCTSNHLFGVKRTSFKNNVREEKIVWIPANELHRGLRIKSLYFEKSNKFENLEISNSKDCNIVDNHIDISNQQIPMSERLTSFIENVSDDELLNDYYNNGLSSNEIAKKYGVNNDIVEYRLYCMLNVINETDQVVNDVYYLDEYEDVYDVSVLNNDNLFIGNTDNVVLVHNCGGLINKDKKKFGIIKGVTDKEYYTNSFHVPVYYKISMVNKIKIEAPYHDLCNAGAISYVEVDGDLMKNVDAFKKIVLFAKENNLGYFSINHPVDRCPVCGYVGVINDTCPKCGFKEDEGVPIEKLKSLGICCN